MALGQGQHSAEEQGSAPSHTPGLLLFNAGAAWPWHGTGAAARPPSPTAAPCTDPPNGRKERKETGTPLWNHIIPKLREEVKVKSKGRVLAKAVELPNLTVSSSHETLCGGMA